MSSVQTPIPFTPKKRTSIRISLKSHGKENKNKLSVQTESYKSPTKRENVTYKEHDCSPPKRNCNTMDPGALIERFQLQNEEQIITVNSTTTHEEVKNKSPVKKQENNKSPTKRENVSDNEQECSPTKRNCNPNSPSVLIEKLQLQNEEQNVTENTTTKYEGKTFSSAIRALHTAQPSQLPGREDKIKELSTILKDCVTNRKSTTLYISGQPGTGKTACLSYITGLPEIVAGYKVVYVNCTGIKSSTAIYKCIIEQLSLKVKGTNGKLSQDIIKYLQTSKKMILMVLDELDQLDSKRQTLLYSIFEWPSLPQSNIVLIGIANALDLTDRVLPRLQSRLELKPTLIHFTPYSKEEIVDIISNRLLSAGVGNVLPGGALQLLASKVAAVSGDIRRALDVARRVIELSQMNEKDGATITLQDVLTVVSNVYNTATALQTNHEEDAECFPLQQKLLICTSVLIRQKAKAKDLTIGKLHDVYKRICEKRNMSSLDLSEFLNLADLVASRGIIKIQGKTKNRLSKVSLQWDEVEISNALKDKQLLSTILADVSCL